MNKLYGTSVLISEDTYRLAQHAIEARELDIIAVAGKSEPVRIYELMAEAGGLDATRVELRAAFAHGFEAYRQQDWGAAEKQFEGASSQTMARARCIWSALRSNATSRHPPTGTAFGA